jgi:hypothetical protein
MRSTEHAMIWVAGPDAARERLAAVVRGWQDLSNRLRLRPRTILLAGTLFSLFAAAVSCTYTWLTGTSLWSLEADPSADWRYVVLMNLVYWNSWALLTPAILVYAERVPIERGGWRALWWHAAAGLVFVALHVLLAASGRTWLQAQFGIDVSWWRAVPEAYLRTLDWELTYYWAVVGLAHALRYYRHARALERAVERSVQDTPRDAGAPGELPASHRHALRRLIVRDAGGVTLVPFDEIDWVEAAGNYVCVHAGADTHIIRDSMKSLEARLAPSGFLRIHRGTIVNLARVKAVEIAAGRDAAIVLQDGTRLAAARQIEQRLRGAFDARG